MIIGIEAQRLFRKNKHGMDRVALELVRAFCRLPSSHNFVLFVQEGEDPCISSTSSLQVKVLPKLPYPIWEQYLLPRAVHQAGCDVLHCTANTAPLRCKVPLILTLHDVIFREQSMWRILRGGSAYQAFGNFYRRLLLPFILPKSQKITTVSHYEKKEIIRFFPRVANKLEVVHNGVGKEFVPVYKSELWKAVKERYSLPESFLLFFGSTASKKNTANVLRAYALLKKKRPQIPPLVIADIFFQQLRKFLQETGLSNLDIHICGYISFDDLPVIYSHARLFLYPSLRESFGLPILEALACGTPVVTSNSSALPEVAGNVTFLSDPKLPQSIAKAMDEAMLQPRGVGESERIAHAQNFLWDQAAQKILSLYNSINAAS